MSSSSSEMETETKHDSKTGSRYPVPLHQRQLTQQIACRAKRQEETQKD